MHGSQLDGGRVLPRVCDCFPQSGVFYPRCSVAMPSSNPPDIFYRQYVVCLSKVLLVGANTT